MSFDIDAGSGYEDVAAFGKRITDTMLDRHGTYLEKAAELACERARSNLQNNGNIATGELLASIRILEISDNGLTVVFGSDVIQSKYIEKGRGPVEAKEGHTLSWIDKTTGKRIFAKSVKEFAAHPFMEPAVIEIEHDFPEMIVDAEQDFITESSR